MVQQGRPRGISFHLQQDSEAGTTSASHQEDTKEMLPSLGFIPHPGAMAHSHQKMMGPGKPGMCDGRRGIERVGRLDPSHWAVISPLDLSPSANESQPALCDVDKARLRARRQGGQDCHVLAKGSPDG